jgi:hypothetical protein
MNKMSKYEVVMWGDRSYFQTNCGNPWQACLRTLDEFLENNTDIDIPIEPFMVKNLETDEFEIVGLAEVLAIRNLSANFEDELVKEESFAHT